jgi:hypothetical protein
MQTIQGSTIFLAQFKSDQAPYNGLKRNCQ